MLLAFILAAETFEAEAAAGGSTRIRLAVKVGPYNLMLLHKGWHSTDSQVLWRLKLAVEEGIYLDWLGRYWNDMIAEPSLMVS